MGGFKVEVVLPGGRQRMIVERSERIGSLFYWFGRHHLHQLALAKRLVPQNGLFLDVGANVGEFSVSIAVSKPKAKILAIEPSASIREELEANIKVNQLFNVTCFPCALGEQQGKETLYQCEDSLLTSLYPVTSTHAPTGETEVRTLDELVESESLARLDLLKIDVEGHELKVLLGGEKTLEKLRPSIILEVNSVTSQSAGFSLSELFDLLAKHRYRVLVRRDRTWRVSELDDLSQEDVWAEPAERMPITR